MAIHHGTWTQVWSEELMGPWVIWAPRLGCRLCQFHVRSEVVFLPLRFWCMPGKQPNSSSLLSGIFRAGRQFYSFWLGNQKRVNKFRMLFSHVFDDQGGNKIIRNFHIHMFLKSFHIFQVSCDLLYLIVAYCFVTCCDLLGPHSPHLPPTLPGDSQVSSGRGRKWSRQVTRLPKG